MLKNPSKPDKDVAFDDSNQSDVQNEKPKSDKSRQEQLNPYKGFPSQGEFDNYEY